jgi:hypothetical protein
MSSVRTAVLVLLTTFSLPLFAQETLVESIEVRVVNVDVVVTNRAGSFGGLVEVVWRTENVNRSSRGTTHSLNRAYTTICSPERTGWLRLKMLESGVSARRRSSSRKGCSLHRGTKPETFDRRSTSICLYSLASVAGAKAGNTPGSAHRRAKA